MPSSRSQTHGARARAGRRAARALAALAVTGLVVCACALASGNFTYRGDTSQGRPIFFLLYGSAVNNMWLRIVDTCPRHRKLFVTDRNVPSMSIRRSRFQGRFHAHGSPATLSISGRVVRRVVSGTITDRTKSARTHRFCSGRATFRLRPS